MRISVRADFISEFIAFCNIGYRAREYVVRTSRVDGSLALGNLTRSTPRFASVFSSFYCLRHCWEANMIPRVSRDQSHPPRHVLVTPKPYTLRPRILRSI